MGYYCVIIGSLGVITLGGVTVNGALGSGTMTGIHVGAIVGTSLGNTVVWVLFGFMVLKVCANLLMACNWLSPIVKWVCGTGSFIMCISYLTPLVACYDADNPGMMWRCDKNYTTSTCLSPLVLVV